MDSALCQRVVLVVLDGLRPDAIETLQLPTLLSLQAAGASTLTAQTVWPPVTAAAMASLLTGVHPPDHGLTSDRLHIPRSRADVQPLPACLQSAGYITSAFLAEPPLLFRRLARALAERLGVAKPTFSGQCASQIVDAASATLGRQRRGLILLHLPDADRAGHAHGWMSRQYCQAAHELDSAVARIAVLALSEPDTLLVLCADHGGGGVVANDHESDHPLDRTIPIIVAGADVSAGTALGDAHIVDIPATIINAFGLAIPSNYAGRPLSTSHIAPELALANA